MNQERCNRVKSLMLGINNRKKTQHYRDSTVTKIDRVSQTRLGCIVISSTESDWWNSVRDAAIIRLLNDGETLDSVIQAESDNESIDSIRVAG